MDYDDFVTASAEGLAHAHPRNIHRHAWQIFWYSVNIEFWQIYQSSLSLYRSGLSITQTLWKHFQEVVIVKRSITKIVMHAFGPDSQLCDIAIFSWFSACLHSSTTTITLEYGCPNSYQHLYSQTAPLELFSLIFMPTGAATVANIIHSPTSTYKQPT